MEHLHAVTTESAKATTTIGRVPNSNPSICVVIVVTNTKYGTHPEA